MLYDVYFCHVWNIYWCYNAPSHHTACFAQAHDTHITHMHAHTTHNSSTCVRTHRAANRTCIRTHCTPYCTCVRTHCAAHRACVRTHCTPYGTCVRTHRAAHRTCVRTLRAACGTPQSYMTSQHHQETIST